MLAIECARGCANGDRIASAIISAVEPELDFERLAPNKYAAVADDCIHPTPTSPRHFFHMSACLRQRCTEQKESCLDCLANVVDFFSDAPAIFLDAPLDGVHEALLGGSSTFLSATDDIFDAPPEFPREEA